MKAYIAEKAGFCAGVRRAVDLARAAAETGRACAYGPVVHSKAVMDELGVPVIDDLGEAGGRVVILRAHGVPPNVYARLNALGLAYVDCTCPWVARLQQLARAAYEAGRAVVLAGDMGHPEVVSVNGFAGGAAFIVSGAAALEPLNLKGRRCTLLAQTTFDRAAYEAIAAALKALTDEAEIFDTICPATRERQEAAEKLAARVDAMVILGDKTSANTRRLFEICKEVQKNSYFLEKIQDYPLQNLKKYDRVGISAGASTPEACIREAYCVMNELENVNSAPAEQPEAAPIPEQTAQPLSEQSGDQPSEQSFEELLNEQMVALHTGDIVPGTVISIQNGEVLVNLGYKSDGVIPKGQFSADPDADVEALVKPGDRIEVFVVRVNDTDGNVQLSHKRVSERKDFEALEKAAETGDPLPGKIIEIVKGGAIALINGVRAFVPSSQASDRFVRDLNELKGREFNFQIIQFEKGKRRVVAGRRELAAKEANAKREAVLAGLEPGMKVKGTVSRISDFGAFVDLGGVDGLVHISRLAWGRVKKVSDVLSEGQEVEVYVGEINKEKGKISLSLKDVNADPWRTADTRYPVGEVIEGKVVRLVPFGAFIALEDGVDGLVHISQIADRRIAKPDDVLTIGDTVRCRVLNVDLTARRISLSIRAAEERYDEEGYDDEYDDEYDDADYDDADYDEAAYDAAPQDGEESAE